jgi:hypothetical protein
VQYANENADDYGVNVAAGGELSGYAWGENIGWVNFDTASLGEQRARFDACSHRFYGFAWSENTGWINLGAAEAHLAVGPCGFADRDCDGDVDLDDYEYLAELLAGPGADAACAAFDHDGDGDLDLEDFAAFQGAFGEAGDQ